MCKKVIKVEEGKTTFKDLQNAMKEFEVLFNINHPCICHAIGVNTCEVLERDEETGNEITTIALFLEFIENSLTECLTKQRLNNTQKAKIIVEIAQAMSFIHKLGMIHRDLKVDNIMLDSNYDVKLIDFGLVSINESLFDNYSLTTESKTKGIGTLAFMSPEMLNEEEYDNKTDVFSFGIVLYYVFIGKIPKYSLKDKVNGIPIKLPKASYSISDFCLSLISKCLEHESAKRPAFEDILKELRMNSYSLADEVNSNEIDEKDKFLESFKLSYKK
ncbi:hypothetical protein M9Y10_037518 [Tritrichomonas musculus]|uniref:Protein kinase domain-containing protein n=1 Tax=Tritrichomonas musculus TaxID=1915356 RepID=A0ABR2GRL8_9EUKA